jgi:membrane-anchored protein YejM (alkaline phosphatase superfamily)
LQAKSFSYAYHRRAVFSSLQLSSSKKDKQKSDQSQQILNKLMKTMFVEKHGIILVIP